MSLIHEAVKNDHTVSYVLNTLETFPGALYALGSFLFAYHSWGAHTFVRNRWTFPLQPIARLVLVPF